ncbi:MAG TPA: carboxypeptidase-like regulatory domain-containing protein [Polyangiaceae bacterium]|nr:carboxypeptidase-like regulatory domain-containing protein [Polyangiaceae bacterium]
MSSQSRILCFRLGLLGWLWAGLEGGTAHAAHLRISSATRIAAAGVTLDGKWISARGELKDDAANPIADAPLKVELPGQRAAAELSRCDDEAEPGIGSEAQPSLLATQTDGLGQFCVRVAAASLGQNLSVQFLGNDLYERSSTLIELKPLKRDVELHFDRKGPSVRLDQAPFEVRVNTSTTRPLASERSISISLYKMAAGRPMKIGETLSVQLSKAATFRLSAQELGPVGQSEIQAAFAGDESSAPVDVSTILTVTSPVTLAVEDQPQRALIPAGWTVRVQAITPFGAPPEGTIEARSVDKPVAEAPLIAGLATLTLPTQGLDRGASELTIHYLPKGPWWIAPTPLRVPLPGAAPKPTWPGPLAIAMLGAIAVMVWRSWHSPLPATRKPVEDRAQPGVSASKLALTDGAPTQFRGIVIDVHDRQPIIGATIELLRPSFQATEQVDVTTTNDEGRFEFQPPAAGAGSGLILRVRAPEHRGIDERLLQPAELVVALVKRRRALISELVNWATARQLGAASSGPNPTPAQIARSATETGQGAAGSWALAIEDAAFGDGPVDERRETQVANARPGQEDKS